MQIIRITFCIVLLCAQSLHAQSTQTSDPAFATGPHIEVGLVSEFKQLSIGENWLGVLLKPDPEWHTYWRNPGDSGEPPVVNWTLPEGVNAGKIEWPLPEAIRVAHLVNYGYNGDVLLMVPINIESAFFANNKSLEIQVDLSWLVCKEDCIPGWATLKKQIALGESPEKSEYHSLFEKTRERLPSKQLLSAKHEFTEQHIIVAITPPAKGDWQLFPFDSATIQHNAEQESVENEDGLSLVLKKSDYFAPASELHKSGIQFLLSNGKQGFYLTSELNSGAENSTSKPLIIVMLMAFAGGLILNLMPCVLPVLSIKALSLQNTQQPIMTKLAYAVGVILSFNLFAVLIIALKFSGDAVGWGFHMQSPWVIAVLSYLFVYIALTLFDIAPAGEKLAGLGQGFIKGDGFTSQFATGVLAVIVASPCTAPFMAAALGVALVSEPIITIVLFTSLALGFALPMTLLFWLPKLTRKIPKPGPWMVTFRQFFAFPMLGTVIWLVWVYQSQLGSLAQLLLLTGLLIFSLAIWLLSKVVKTIPVTLSLALLVAAIAIPIFDQNQQSAGVSQTNNTGAGQTFSKGKLAELKAGNNVVFVNMTADWCITCKVNEQVALNSSELDNVLSKSDVHYLVGDWTNKNQEILDYLQIYQRAGVPLYVVYSGESGYQVLPQILTTEIVINAIEKALGEIQNEI